MPRFRASVTAAIVASLSCALPLRAFAQGTPARRAILVSFDSFNEKRATGTIDSATIPAITRLFARGACADHARSAFPSITAAAHAALWTGTWGDVNGIVSNSQSILPRLEHTLAESRSGFEFAALRAEPIWVTAARAGKRVVALQATQSPGAPGYPSVDAPPDATAVARRADAERVLAGENVSVLTGFNRSVSTPRMINEGNTQPVPARGWLGTDRLVDSPAPREFYWLVGTDTLFALMAGTGGAADAGGHYDRLYVSRTRDVGAAIEVRPAPLDTTPIAGRELARHFSRPIVIDVAGGGRAFVALRLFALAADGTTFDLFQPELAIVDPNHPAFGAAYEVATGGIALEGGAGLWQRGGFGPTFYQNGTGAAEARWMEAMEYSSRQFARGEAWAWRTLRPDLFITYVPMGDEADHALYGYLDTTSPLYDATRARRAAAVRAKIWALIDRRMAELQALVASEPGAALFVVGDHGMRAGWRTFRPNVALANAGLLVADTAGRVQVDQTRALSVNGYYIAINRAAWKSGVVKPGDERAVLDAAEKALLAVRDEKGNPVVTRTFRVDAATDSLGIGGPLGGDLYYEVAPGVHWGPVARGPVTILDQRPSAGHGFVSTAPDMWTVFCAMGASFPAHRIGETRNIDVAPTISDWIGTPAPPDARGKSVLGALQGGRTP